MNEVRVRIAPSPTGYLHIGTARTALFNYLFAKKHKGKFLLRIEDTDFARNNEQSYNSILNGLKFLGLTPDEEVIYQSQRMEEHVKMAQKLVENGHAYYCFLPLEEIEKRKEQALASGGRYVHKFTKGDDAPVAGIKPVIRMKVPRNVEIVNEDLVQGRVSINSETIEDFVILRSDSTPVYMLSVVCDDIFMKITHVIRGDDHLTNTPKQILIYKGLQEEPPLFAHIPLIHGADGKKLSKRHGAMAVEDYRTMGYLPESLRSYLVRLGWGSENDEILSDADMQEAFDVSSISRAPSRFDFEKLNNINHHFIKTLPLDYIIGQLAGGFSNLKMLERACFKVRYRYNTIAAMQEDFKAFEDGFSFTEEALKVAKEGKDMIKLALEFCKNFALREDQAFSGAEEVLLGDEFEKLFKDLLKEKGVGFGKVGPVLRAALIGKLSSLGVFEIIYILGLAETIKRLENGLKL